MRNSACAFIWQIHVFFQSLEAVDRGSETKLQVPVKANLKVQSNRCEC